MSKAIIFMIISLVFRLVHAQQYDTIQDIDTKKVNEIVLPENVRSAFRLNFANAKNAIWNIENDDKYLVEFMMNNEKSSAVFDDQGNLIESATEIRQNDLPATVQEVIKIEYPNYTVKKAEQRNSSGNITYRVEAEKDTAIQLLIFDIKGQKQ